jgi:hypothetical protein
VAAGQSQPLYSGVGIFNWYYLSPTPRELELQSLICTVQYTNSRVKKTERFGLSAYGSVHYTAPRARINANAAFFFFTPNGERKWSFNRAQAQVHIIGQRGTWVNGEF